MVEKPYTLEVRDRWLVLRFAEPWAVLSWAVVNGGWQTVTQIAWHYLEINEIRDVADPVEWLRARMHAEGLAGAVGFMTSRRARTWNEAQAHNGGTDAWAVATSGFSNALRVGDAGGAGVATPGTINLLVCCSTPLTVEAAVEALAVASEAKTLAVLANEIPSVKSGLPATGTGTDYLAVAWPIGSAKAAYAGKHTPVGAAVGQAAHAVVADGARDWKKEFQSNG